MAKPKKKIVTDQLDDISPYDFEGTMVDLRNKLNDWIDEYGPTAKISWDPDHWYQYDTSPSPRFFINHDREETDAEYEKRMKDEALSKSLQEQRELQELQRLQDKYGKTK